MKKLNRKGFTLIELLAVIVILAIVMGVATTSVLSAMNNSRRSSLLNSAKTAADAFRVAYAEASLNNQTTLLEVASATSSGAHAITSASFTKLNITVNNYIAGGDDDANGNKVGSFVYYDSANEKYDVCLVANTSGSYYVASGNTKADTGLGTLKFASGTMFACSNDNTSW